MSGNWITLEVVTERQAQIRRETMATHGGFRGDASERDAIALHDALRAPDRLARAIAAAVRTVMAMIAARTPGSVVRIAPPRDVPRREDTAA